MSVQLSTTLARTERPVEMLMGRLCVTVWQGGMVNSAMKVS